MSCCAVCCHDTIDRDVGPTSSFSCMTRRVGESPPVGSRIQDLSLLKSSCSGEKQRNRGGDGDRLSDCLSVCLSFCLSVSERDGKMGNGEGERMCAHLEFLQVDMFLKSACAPQVSVPSSSSKSV